MAYKYCSIFAFLVMINILLSGYALAGREIPTESKSEDVKKPESFIGHDHDGTVLVPGFGRYYVFPRPGSHFDPFNYNPVTGTSGQGNGIVTPGSGFTGGTGSSNPGGDDVPDPGMGSPIPGGDSSPPTPSTPATP